MSIYDLLMLIVVVASVLFGLWKGLAWQLASLGSIFVSYFVALNFRGSLAPLISASEPWNRFAAMLILFLATSLVIWMAYGYLKKTIRRLRLRGFDSQAGALLGAFKGALLCMLITLFGVTLFGENVRRSVIASRSGGYISAAINRLNAMVPFEVHAVLDPYVRRFNDHLADEDPGFLEISDEKLDRKLQTIRGRFQLPATATRSSGRSVPGDDNRESLPEQIGNQLFDTASDAANKVLNEGYTAGQDFINGGRR